jgi:hypothetical protein
MSNLLEEAIIDATALRETALKSAEAALIEKYSKEFKESVKRLLEQEEMPSVPPEMPSPEGAAEVAGTTPSVDALAGAGMPTAQTVGKAFDNVPSSFLDGDDDELITIDFDQLKKQISSALVAQPETPEASPEMEVGAEEKMPMEPATQMELEETLDLELEMYDAGGHYEQGQDALSEEEWSGEEELEEQDMGSSQDPRVQSAQAKLASEKQKQAQVAKTVAQAEAELAAAQGDATEKQQQKQAAVAQATQEELEEDFSITEEELAELAEELKVDLNPEHQLRGYMGTTNIEKHLASNVEKAAARDSKAEKEREEQEKAMADLKDKLAESQNQNKKMFSLIDELKDNLVSLKEHTEKLSVSNAKLLYTNKVLADVSLNERQKQQIAESISKASTVLEAKTIFGTLQSAVQSVSEKKPRESLSEALIRGSSPFLNRQKVASIEDNLSDRMKILAGIKTKT